MSVFDLIRPRRSTSVLVGVVMFAALSAGAAQAASVSTTGSTAWNSGNTLTVQDTKAEGDAAYANWNGNTHNRVQTTGGNGSTNSVTPGSLSNFRACRDQGTFNPDNCSSWVSP